MVYNQVIQRFFNFVFVNLILYISQSKLSWNLKPKVWNLELGNRKGLTNLRKQKEEENSKLSLIWNSKFKKARIYHNNHAKENMLKLNPSHNNQKFKLNFSNKQPL